MSFVLSKMLWVVLRPSALLVLLATLGALRGRRRGGRTLLWLGLSGLLAVMVLPLDRWALRPLEDRFAPAALPAWVDGIIVLGGAVETRLSADRDRPSLNGAAERMTEFVALARRYPQARLVFTGGNGLLEGGTPEAAPARALFQSLGVAPERLEFESASRTTWDNAVFSHDLLHPQQGEVWVLITSASHMPRAMGTFRQAGWPVLPWPVGYKSLSRAVGWLPDSGLAERLLLLDWAAHEWAGMLAYWLMGRSDAPFPAPMER
jgi:uncharacterized SAM-binding protein YcdF (DUF218 family)